MSLSKINSSYGGYSIKVNIGLKDSSQNAIKNARVTVQATGAVNGTGSGYTNQNGQLTLSTRPLYSTRPTTFSITQVVDAAGKKLELSGVTTKTIN
jgi:hypothetical protein